MTPRGKVAGLLLTIVVSLGFGCSSKQPGPATTGPTTAGPTTSTPTSAGPTTSAPTTAGPTTSTPTSAGPDISVTDTDNGRTLAVQRGAVVTLVLQSTYWTGMASSNTAVLAPLSPPAVAPTRQGCVPGQGCGTVTMSYRATAPGSAVVSASRTTCGEARLCSAAEQSYRVVFNVPS